jgi:hypothetical protein
MGEEEGVLEGVVDARLVVADCTHSGSGGARARVRFQDGA